MAAASKTTTNVQTYLSPVGLDKLLGDTRQQHMEIVTHLPSKIRTDFMRESGFAKEIVLRGPSSEALRQCHPKSLMAAFINSASLGLTLNPLKKHCTIIARFNSKEGIHEASNLIMFQGLIFLATQAGVKDIVADVVYSADKFSMKRTHEGDHYEHEINIVSPRGSSGNEFLGVYVAAKMPGSSYPKVEWIPKEDIFLMRQQSDSYLDKSGKPRDSSPWVKWFDEMAKKGGIKRAQKRWEELVETNDAWNVFKQAVETDNRQERREPIEGSAEEVECITLEQATQIDAAAKIAEMEISKLFDAYNVSALPEIPASKFEEVMARIKTFGDLKKEKKAKTGSKK